FYRTSKLTEIIVTDSKFCTAEALGSLTLNVAFTFLSPFSGNSLLCSRVEEKSYEQKSVSSLRAHYPSRLPARLQIRLRALGTRPDYAASRVVRIFHITQSC